MHQSVLATEAIEALAVRADGIYVDGTFGRGGHSRLILERLGPRGRLIALDRDPQASWWKRLLLGFEEHVEPDGSGRVLLPPALRQHAKLERDAMMVGQGRYFELWDSGVWSAKLGQAFTGSATPPAGIEGFSL